MRLCSAPRAGIGLATSTTVKQRVVISGLHSTAQRLRIWYLEQHSPSSNFSSFVKIWSQNVQIKIPALLLIINLVTLGKFLNFFLSLYVHLTISLASL